MKKNFITRNRFIHLYDPKEECVGDYDAHYINAHKKIISLKKEANKKDIERYAA